MTRLLPERDVWDDINRVDSEEEYRINASDRL